MNTNMDDRYFDESIDLEDFKETEDHFHLDVVPLVPPPVEAPPAPTVKTHVTKVIKGVVDESLRISDKVANETTVSFRFALVGLVSVVGLVAYWLRKPWRRRQANQMLIGRIRLSRFRRGPERL